MKIFQVLLLVTVNNTVLYAQETKLFPAPVASKYGYIDTSAKWLYPPGT